MLAESEMGPDIDEALQSQLLRRRDSVVTESEHLARLLAHVRDCGSNPAGAAARPPRVGARLQLFVGDVR